VTAGDAERAPKFAVVELTCEALAARGKAWPGRLPRWGDLAPAEREHCAASLPRLDRYAGRLAAKRSVRRLAYEIAGAPMLPLNDIVVDRLPDGRPQVAMRGTACERLRHAGPIDVSIAHRGARAIAVAVTNGHAGVDLVEHALVRRADEDHLARLAKRVLGSHERESAWFRAAPRLGVLMALTAKECVGKLLKRTHPSISWHDVRIEVADRSTPAHMVRLGEALRAGIGRASPHFGLCTTAAQFGGRHLWVGWVHACGFTYAAAFSAGGGHASRAVR